MSRLEPLGFGDCLPPFFRAGRRSASGEMGAEARVLVLAISALVAMVLVSGASGQASMDCASKLVSCAPFIGQKAKPNNTCCRPLKEAIDNTKERECLCNLYADDSIFKSFGINKTDAVALPGRCGIANASLVGCKNNSAPSPSPTAGGDVTPPAAKGGSNNSACGLAWMGISGWTGLVLFWASTMVSS